MDCLFLEGNDTSFWFDTWTIVFENKSLGRESISNWIQGKMTVFGSVLATWIVVANIILCLLFVKYSADEEEQLDTSSPGQTSRWIQINVSLIQALIGGVSIPVNLVTYAKGAWIFGRSFCNASLVGQMFLVANTVWTMVAITSDLLFRLFWVRSVGRWWTVVNVSGAWVMSSIAVLPMAFQLEYSAPNVLPEVCAVVMTKTTSVLLSVGVFLLPAAIATTGSAVYLATRWRVGHSVIVVSETDGKRAEEKKDVVEQQQGCSPPSDGPPGSVAAVACTTLLWGPFFAVNAFVSFCADMCVDPWVWSLLLWTGYASSALLPFAWTLDRRTRDAVRAAARSLKGGKGNEDEAAASRKPRLTSSNDNDATLTSSPKDRVSSENEKLL